MYSDMHCMPAENGIAPLTPSRGKLAAPFKLVAPNADMKDIPATFVVRIRLVSVHSTILETYHLRPCQEAACTSSPDEN